MVESCIVIFFMCLLFMGVFQVAHAYISGEILYNAAARAARAKTVGLNRMMVEKSMLAAAIANSGTLTCPSSISSVSGAFRNALATDSPGALWDFALKSNPTPPTLNTELQTVPVYLGSGCPARGSAVLDYQNWDGGNYISSPFVTIGLGVVNSSGGANQISVRVTQPYDWLIALSALATGSIQTTTPGSINLYGDYAIEEHYSLYLNDSDW